MIINQAALAGIGRGFKTIFNQAFQGGQPQWPIVAMQAPSDGSEEDYKWLGAFPKMREWIGERQVKNLSAFTYTIKNKPFESTISVDRDDIEDDKIGVYTPLIQGLAHEAATHPDELVFALLKSGFAATCFDGQYFFDTDHDMGGTSVSNFGGGTGTPWYLLDLSRPIKPLVFQIRRKPQFVEMDDPKSENVFRRKEFLYGVDDRKNVGFGLWQLAYGSKQELTPENYAAARAAMMSLKTEEDKPLGITPTHLVVPPTLESAGRKILKNSQLAGGATNEWFETAELLNVSWLA
ncbi:MAG: Mu-like prophage major head subunit gpT family protein [Desulfovibrio sp.]|uniref:Mu-like prophage major head subunit gpT family protein n=1 Tax=Desulfovibrio sp. 7SRBS1 TaxID=3378064 RepID=UPI003B3F07AD